MSGRRSSKRNAAPSPSWPNFPAAKASNSPVRTIPQKTIPLTTTEGVVLGLLAEGERSGYDLLKRAEASVGHMWSPAKSQLYAVLPRLVAAGLAKSKTVRQKGRPDKQLYRLTPAGRSAVRTWLEQETPRTWDELLLKAFFARLVPRAALLRQLEAYREVQLELLAEYEAIEPATRYGALTLRYGLALIPVRLAWLDDAVRELSR
jgi:PadR family transcriptional regulator, regulatory protein AphA